MLGGGPKVAANVQAGKTNTQTIGTTQVAGDQKIVRPTARDIRQSQDTNKVQAERVETVVVNEYPIWLILAFVVAVFLDSPIRMIKDTLKVFKKRKDNA